MAVMMATAIVATIATTIRSQVIDSWRTSRSWRVSLLLRNWIWINYGLIHFSPIFLSLLVSIHHRHSVNNIPSARYAHPLFTGTIIDTLDVVLVHTEQFILDAIWFNNWRFPIGLVRLKVNIQLWSQRNYWPLRVDLTPIPSYNNQIGTLSCPG